jgi:predicted HNH restriction endonuclease
MRQRYLANQRKNFGGRRDELLSILGGKCQKCGLTDEQSVERFGRKLDIHHKDGHGRTSDSPNHSEDNLMILCPPCHRLLHITLKKGAAA